MALGEKTSCRRAFGYLIGAATVFLFAQLVAMQAAEPAVKLAVFDVDATPPLGSAMAYDPVRRLDELTLRCRGIVLLSADKPIVLCAVDWIGIANEGNDVFRDELAAAAGTSRDRVAVHTLHQHDAPGCDFTAERIIHELKVTNYRRFDGTFHRQVIRHAADAIRAALLNAQPVTHYGWGLANGKEVASNRRKMGPDGHVRAERYTATKDAALRAEPEGVIDPQVSLLSFWNGDKPLAMLSYYACHPQLFPLGIPSPDFTGIAFHPWAAPYLKPCMSRRGGRQHLGVGKYNDGRWQNRMLLARHWPRNEAGVDNDDEAHQWFLKRHPVWQTVPEVPAPWRNALERSQAHRGDQNATVARLHCRGRSACLVKIQRIKAMQSMYPACVSDRCEYWCIPGDVVRGIKQLRGQGHAGK